MLGAVMVGLINTSDKTGSTDLQAALRVDTVTVYALVFTASKCSLPAAAQLL